MAKLQKELVSLDFSAGTCLCKGPTKTPAGLCRYRDHCNTTIVVYKVICKKCSFYLDSMQNTLKKLMTGHYSDVREWFKK